jgi:protein-tyrosine phosphatase
MSTEHAEALAEFGVTHALDLRTQEERDLRPVVVPDQTTVVSVDVLADEPTASPASLGAIARAVLAGDTAALTADRLDQIFVTGYRSFVTLGSARGATSAVLQRVADPESGPVVIHCTAGKDRTGWVVAVLLTAVGVPWDAVMADYLRSGPEVLALFAPYREQVAEQGGDVAAMERAIAVFPHYLEAARDQVVADFGSWDNYLTRGLGLPNATRDSLHTQLLG